MRARAAMIPLLAALTGCPDPGGGEGGTSDGAGDTGGSPQCPKEPQDTVDPGERLNFTFAYEEADSPQQRPDIAAVDIPAADICPEFVFEGLQPLGEVRAVVARPAVDDAGTWPEGSFPLFLFQHGNGQDATLYPELLERMASRGYVAVSFEPGDQTVDPKQRGVWLRCAARVLAGPDSPWEIASERLNGQVVLGGHSTGGAGALYAARRLLDNGDLGAATIEAAVMIAPGGDDGDEELRDTDVSVLAIQGSNDQDANEQAFSLFDRARGRGLGAMVWARNVRHNNYGGRTAPLVSECGPSERGLALVDEYVPAFADFVVRNVPEDGDMFDRSELAVPESVAATYQDPDDPPVYGAVLERDDPSRGYERFVVDDFEDGDPSISSGDSSLPVSSEGVFAQDELEPELHATGVGLFEVDGEGSLSWALDEDAREALAGATAISLRLGVDSGVVPSPGVCPDPDRPIPAVSLRLTGPGLEVAFPLGEYGRLALPFTEPNDIDCTSKGGCTGGPYLQTSIRLPLADACDETGGFLQNAETLTLEIEGEDAGLYVDDLIILRSPRDEVVDCACSEPL